MNLFTRTFSKIFKSSNQQELDKTQNLILAINNKENERVIILNLNLVIVFPDKRWIRTTSKYWLRDTHWNWICFFK